MPKYTIVFIIFYFLFHMYTNFFLSFKRLQRKITLKRLRRIKTQLLLSNTTIIVKFVC